MNKLLADASSVAWKEFRHMRRDRFTIVLTLGLPLFQLLLFGYAIRFEPPRLTAALLNNDGGRYTRQLAASMEASGIVRFEHTVRTEDEIRALMRSGKISAAVETPVGYSQSILSKAPKPIRVWIDGADGPTAVFASSSLAEFTANAKTPAAIEVLFNPSMRTANFMVPAVLSLLVHMIVCLLLSGSVVRERERKTLDIVLASGISPLGFALGKTLAYSLYGLALGSALLSITCVIFQIPLSSGPILAALALLAIIPPTVAIALLIGYSAKHHAQALQFTYLIFLPSVMLSGFIYPRGAMPEPAQWISQILPTTYFVRLMRGVTLRDAGIRDLLPDLAALLAITLVLGIVALRLVRRDTSS